MDATPLPSIPLPATLAGNTPVVPAHQAADSGAQLCFAQIVAEVLAAATLTDAAQPALAAKSSSASTGTSALAPPAPPSPRTTVSAQDSPNDPNAANLLAALNVVVPFQDLSFSAPPAESVKNSSSSEPQGTAPVSSDPAGNCAASNSAASPDGASNASSITNAANAVAIPQIQLPEILPVPMPSSAQVSGDPKVDGAAPVVVDHTTAKNNSTNANPQPVSATPPAPPVSLASSSMLLSKQALDTILKVPVPELPQPAQPGITPDAAARLSTPSAPGHILPEALSALNAPPNPVIAAVHTEPPAPVVNSFSSALQTLLAGQNVSAIQQASGSGSPNHQPSQDSSANQSQQGRSDVPANLDPVSPILSSHDLQKFSSAVVAAGGASAQPVFPTTLATSTPVSIAASATPMDRSSASSPPAQDATPSTPHPTAPLWQADGSNRMVSSAQLLAASGHSEMRIALDTEKLGPVELRARMTGDQLGAAILVEKHDAHAALAAELPILQQALNDKQLRIDQVALLHGTFSSHTQDAGTHTKQDQSNPRHTSTSAWSSNGATPSFIASVEPKEIFDSHGRLSVHA
jgi:hypothetical protein